MRSDHQLGEVVRGEKRSWHWRSPAIQRPDVVPDLGVPELVVDYAVHVGVVLAEVACGVFEVPEEVGPDVVPAQAPHVAAWVIVQQGGGAAADLVHIVDLPGGVVQERHRCGLDEEVVVIGGTSEERGRTADCVADLEADSLNEELLAGLKVGGAQDDVAEFARSDGVLAPDGLAPGGAAVGSAGRVLGGRGRRCLGDRVGDAEDDSYPGARIDGGEGGWGALGGDV